MTVEKGKKSRTHVRKNKEEKSWSTITKEVTFQRHDENLRVNLRHDYYMSSSWISCRMVILTCRQWNNIFFKKKKSIISYLNWFESKVAWHIAGSHWRSRTNHFALTVTFSWRNGVSGRKWNNSLEQTVYCIVKTMDRVCVEVDQDRNKFNRRSQYVFYVCSKGYTYGVP